MYIKIKNEKEKANWSEICPSMASWMTYSRNLDFDLEPDYDLLLGFLRDIDLSKPEPNGVGLQSLNASRCTLCMQTLPKRAAKKGGKASDSLSYNEANLLEIASIKTAPASAETKNLEIMGIPARKMSKSASVRLVSLR